MKNIVTAEGLGKRFARYPVQRPRSLKEAFRRGFKGMRTTEHFWAVHDASFAVAKGQALGCIGQNGSGKSTLLKLVGGIFKPDAGHVHVAGRIGGLLTLGSGFHPELTGRENVFISGVIAGLLRREVEQRFDHIVRFAELEAFIDSPLRTYSTGMQMRLGFSVAVHTDPDILLIDEVLTVGDLVFQQKCIARIQAFKDRGCALVFVSHDLTQVEQLCDDVLWLKNGEVIAKGPPEVIVGQYKAAMSSETRRRTPAAYPERVTSDGHTLHINKNRFGSLEIEILDVRLLNRHNVPCDHVQSGAELRIEITYKAAEPIALPIFGISVSNQEGALFLDVTTETDNLTIDQVGGAGRLILHVERLDLSGGHYFVNVGVYEKSWAYAYDYHWHVYPLFIEAPYRDQSVLSPPRHWEIAEVDCPQ